jgi:hypothetical protein
LKPVVHAKKPISFVAFNSGDTDARIFSFLDRATQNMLKLVVLFCGEYMWKTQKMRKVALFLKIAFANGEDYLPAEYNMVAEEKDRLLITALLQHTNECDHDTPNPSFIALAVDESFRK